MTFEEWFKAEGMPLAPGAGYSLEDVSRRAWEAGQARALEDAARYRWLRERMPYHILCDFPEAADGSKPGLPVGAENWPAGVDAAVDAARKGQA